MISRRKFLAGTAALAAAPLVPPIAPPSALAEAIPIATEAFAGLYQATVLITGALQAIPPLAKGMELRLDYSAQAEGGRLREAVLEGPSNEWLSVGNLVGRDKTGALVPASRFVAPIGICVSCEALPIRSDSDN